MAEMKLKLQPFTVPTFVIAEMPPGLRQDGIKEAPKWALKDLDADTLAELCHEFRRAVFLKAERPDPAAK
jgi:hypothetical protein